MAADAAGGSGRRSRQVESGPAQPDEAVYRAGVPKWTGLPGSSSSPKLNTTSFWLFSHLRSSTQIEGTYVVPARPVVCVETGFDPPCQMGSLASHCLASASSVKRRKRREVPIRCFS